MIITRKRIREGEQYLVDNGLPHLVPDHRRLMIQTWWSQRVSCAFTLVLVVILLVSWFLDGLLLLLRLFAC